jgi:hypothetical protein
MFAWIFGRQLSLQRCTMMQCTVEVLKHRLGVRPQSIARLPGLLSLRD